MTIENKSLKKLLKMRDQALLSDEELIEILSQRVYRKNQSLESKDSWPWHDIEEAYLKKRLNEKEYNYICKEARIEHSNSYNVDFNRHKVGRMSTLKYRCVTEKLPYRVGDIVQLHQNGETIKGKATVERISKDENIFTVKIFTTYLTD